MQLARLTTVTTQLTSLMSQDVARSNAALASARLLSRRREREDVAAYLAEHAPASRDQRVSDSDQGRVVGGTTARTT